MITRYYDNLSKHIDKGKVLVIHGPRQVGKTTLLKKYLTSNNLEEYYVLGDDVAIHEQLSPLYLDKIATFAQGRPVIAIDEAQKIPNIGEALKIITDTQPSISIIATGSSSFELAGQIGEPLTGRKRTLCLYPISVIELERQEGRHIPQSKLEELLVFGNYPAVLTAKTIKEKTRTINELVGAYLLKDILELEKVKSSKILLDLLRLIAYQIGSEISTTELGQKLGLDYKTVARYLDLLEKAFVLYNLRGYSRNLRKEISKMSKYYFYDNGVRNALISNFNSIEIRNDIGQLWENFLVAERLKKQEYREIYANNFFWRTWSGDEIDWVEERGGMLHGYEFKWNQKYEKKPKQEPKDWKQSYPNSSYAVICQDNYQKFIA